MPKFNRRLEERRIAEAERSFDALSKVVRALQEAAYSLLADWFSENIETENGGRTIKFSAGNLGRVQGVFGLLKRFGRRLQSGILDAILGQTDRILDANDAYFGQFAVVTDIQEAARLETLLRWGYNARTKTLIAGGYLDTLFKGSDVSQRVAALLNQAIAARMPLADFRKTFRNVFIGKGGAGMLERHFNTATFDLFQGLDRTVNLIYANRLGLNHAIYSGTIIKTTRPFCRARVGKVFTRNQIEAWADLDFAGKPPIYDPFVHCGGYNCRHHLSFITAEVAAGIKPKQ